MKQSVRSFAIGLFTAGLLLLGGIFFFGSPDSSVEDLAAEDLIDLVEQKGYYVLNKEEYIAASVGRDDSKTASSEITSEEGNEENGQDPSNEEDSSNNEGKEEDDTDDSDVESSSEEEEEEEEENTSYTLSIKEGMASSDISSVLEKNKIIKDAGNFNEYLIDNDYHLKVQIGEYELKTGMSQYEVAEAITK
ncbi:MltG/YceG/YrrL family protein [Oceanobacillus manasiensis]|uniref:hypothetical protein n=1 Tax=Oceanobacillus manasiensis TaxID=586413 RepID=UPI0005AB7F1F|nr:hypothetical protein [Oceanobacillus manasiensis]